MKLGFEDLEYDDLSEQQKQLIDKTRRALHSINRTFGIASTKSVLIAQACTYVQDQQLTLDFQAQSVLNWPSLFRAGLVDN